MKNVVIIFLIFFLSFSCKKKEKSPVPDKVKVSVAPLDTTVAVQNWNSQYIGSYFGVWTSSTYNMGNYGPLLVKDTTLLISANVADSTLTTSLYNCPNIRYYLNVNSFPIYHGRIDFRNDSMFYSCGNGGLGSGNNETFKGKKL